VEHDAAKVIDALNASRGEGKPSWFAEWLAASDRVVLGLPNVVSGSAAQFASKAGLSTPLFATKEAPGWLVAFFIAVAHIFLVDWIKSARSRRDRQEAQGAIARQRRSIELALTRIRNNVLYGTTCRLTILLPRRIGDGTWDLIPVLRSDGIPVAHSRHLRVVGNSLDRCESVCARVFLSDAGALEKACQHGPSYAATMFVSPEFIAAADQHQDCRRNPLYVFAVLLRCGDSRIAVLSVDNDRGENLLEDTPGHFEKLNGKSKDRHIERRRCLEALAEAMPRLALDHLFQNCGVTV